MKLAKNCLDVGLFTNNIQPMLQFWQQSAGLELEEILPTGGGSRQHRHGLAGGVLKINEVAEPLPDAPPSGYRRLIVPSARVTEATDLTDPDGNQVTLVPIAASEGLTIVVHTPDIAAARLHYGTALGLEMRSPDSFACGTTVLILEEDHDQQPSGAMRAKGYRYLTVQVWDADAEYMHALELGAMDGFPPRTMGDVARFGFVRDADGNWMEVSQRASLTGPLPPN